MTKETTAYSVLLFRHKTKSFLTVVLEVDNVKQVRGAVLEFYPGWKITTYDNV